jgi:hypothetical protein
MIFGEIMSQLFDFADNCIIYRKFLNNNDMVNLQIDLNRLRGVDFRK